METHLDKLIREMQELLSNTEADPVEIMGVLAASQFGIMNGLAKEED